MLNAQYHATYKFPFRKALYSSEHVVKEILEGLESMPAKFVKTNFRIYHALIVVAITNTKNSWTVLCILLGMQQPGTLESHISLKCESIYQHFTWNEDILRLEAKTTNHACVLSTHTGTHYWLLFALCGVGIISFFYYTMTKCVFCLGIFFHIFMHYLEATPIFVAVYALQTNTAKKSM